MRRSLIGLMVAAATALVPLLTLAGNQEVAEQVAKALRSSGQLHDYKIGVKYQDGTAWLKGQVNSEEQAKSALAVASQVPGVTKVKNELAVPPPNRPPSSRLPVPGSSSAPAALRPAAASRQRRLCPEQISRVGSTVPSGAWGRDPSTPRRCSAFRRPNRRPWHSRSRLVYPGSGSPVMATESPALAEKAPAQPNSARSLRQ